jgi:hypothetical protein
MTNHLLISLIHEPLMHLLYVAGKTNYYPDTASSRLQRNY